LHVSEAIKHHAGVASRALRKMRDKTGKGPEDAVVKMPLGIPK
jgi:hypothetical protein